MRSGANQRGTQYTQENKNRKFPKSWDILPILVQEVARTPNRIDQNRSPHIILSLTQQSQRIERKKKNNLQR
jgi:hypothetical protein